MAKRSSSVTERSDEESDPDRSPPVSKRARVAPQAKVNGRKPTKKEAAVAEDDDEDEEELDEDDRMEVDENEEREFDQFSAKYASQPRSEAIGNIAECGIIEKIECTNFMNHTLLTIPLGPQINFIVGHNGTGKSALLTALVVGLGGSAAGTDRGKSLAGFIKDDGSERAIISITIKNRGHGAFKPELYGKSIVVERTITKASTNYKLKSAAGGIVSNKRQELSEMLDHFGLQVDNPLCVLMQEKAKAFLTASTPAAFYQSFLRGTGLKQLAEEYQAINVMINQATKDLKRLGEDIPRLKEEAKAAKDRFDRSAALRANQDKLHQLENLMAWSYVVKHQNEIDQAQAKVELEISHREKHEASLREAEATRESRRDEIQEAERQAAEFQAGNAGDEDREKELKEIIDGFRNEVKDLNTQKREIDQSHKDEKRDEAQILKSIREATKAYEAKHQGGRGDKQKRIDDLKSQHATLSDEQRNASRAEIEADDFLNQHTSARDTWEPKVQRARDAFTEAEGRLHNVRGQQRNVLAGYHVSTAAIIDLIDSRQWRAHKPIGPVGRFVKLRDRAWGDIFESVFNENLDTYIVGHETDKHQLLKLLREKGNGATVLKQVQDSSFDFSNALPDASFDTILSKLTIENEIVKHALINTNAIHSSILISGNTEANEVMRKGPRNVSNCYTKDGFRVASNQNSSSTVYLQLRKGVPRLTDDYTQYIADCERDVTETEAALQATQAEWTQLQRQLTSATKNKKQAREAIEKLKKKLVQTDQEAKALEAELLDDAPLDLQDLEEQRDSKRRSIESLQNQYRTIEIALQQRHEVMKPFVQEREQIKRLAIERMADTSQLQENVTQAAARVAEADGHIKHFKDRLVAQNQRITTCEIQRDTLIEQLAEKQDQASAICAEQPDNVNKTPAEYQAEYNKIEKAMEAARRREGGMTIEEMQEASMTAYMRWHKAREQYKTFTDFTSALKSSYKMRTERWQKFRRFTAMLARLNFERNIAMRGFTGVMAFDHPNQKMELYVVTDPDNATQAGGTRSRGSKSLSGGEKSYSTVSMLLALWDSSTSPLRCLDEYDVFMDAVNRRVSTSMIVDVGKKANARQHILVSPNSMSKKFYGLKYVKISRLGDNERGQGVIRAFLTDAIDDARRDRATQLHKTNHKTREVFVQ